MLKSSDQRISMETEIREKLDRFPSCFHTYDFVQTIEKEKKEKILGKVISEMNTDGYDSEFEMTRALNFISYMSFAVGKFEDAVTNNRKALENNGNNINALVSKARYHLHASEFSDSRKQCDLLDKLKNDQIQMLYAKADQAYVCSRLGMTMYTQAEKLFDEALKESEAIVMMKNQNEQVGTCVSQYEICMLKFGLALTIRRQLNISNIHIENIDALGQERQRCNRLFELFLDIIKMPGENIDKHKARTYVQTGETLNLLNRYQQRLMSDDIIAYLPGRNIRFKVIGCYEKAVELQNKDVFVLERFAKYCRVIGQVDRSIKLCRRALNIRETSTCHHYLALALKKKIEFNRRSSYNKPHHVRDLHTQMNAVSANQHQQVNKSLDDSGIYSMEPLENSTSAYNAKGRAVEQTFRYTSDGGATSGASTQVKKYSTDVQDTDIDQMSVDFQNLLTSDKRVCDQPIGPKTDEFRGHLSRSYREGEYQRTQTVTTHAGNRHNSRGRYNQYSHRGKHFYDGREMGNNSYYPSHGEQGHKTKRWNHFYQRPRYSKRNTGKLRAELDTESSSNLERYNRREEQTKQVLSQLIKSPKKLTPLPKDQIGDILYHLDKAMELSDNMAAMYEKALVLRAAGRDEDALDTFKKMFRNKGCSLVQLAGAYEQSAICLQSQIKSGIKTDCSEDGTMIDLKEYLLKTIEITCYLIAKQPKLKNCWGSFPTLKMLLQENPKSKSNIRELGELHRMVEDYNGAIDWFKKVLEMETNDSDKARVHMDIVRDCLKANKYADAVLHLDLVQRLSDYENIIDENLFFEAHIEGGLQSFFKDEDDLAGLRLKNALDYKRCGENQEITQDQNEYAEQDELFQNEWFDVFILCDSKSETTGRHIWRLLRKLGLKATLNDDCAASELPSICGLTKDIERSTHGVVILGNDMDDIRYIQIFTGIMMHVQKIHKYGNIVVVTEDENLQVDPMFTGFASITYAQGLMDSISEDHKLWLKRLLWILASGKKMLE